MREQHTYNLNLPYRKIIVLRLKRKIVLFRQVRLMLSDKCCPSDSLLYMYLYYSVLSEEIRTVSPEAFGKASNHISSKLCECVFKLFDVLQLSTKVFCRLHETNRGGLKKFFFFHRNSQS